MRASDQARRAAPACTQPRVVQDGIERAALTSSPTPLSQPSSAFFPLLVLLPTSLALPPLLVAVIISGIVRHHGHRPNHRDLRCSTIFSLPFSSPIVPPSTAFLILFSSFPLASPLTLVSATIMTPCPLFSAISITAAGHRRHRRRCPPFLFPKTHRALSPIPLHLLHLRRAPPVTAPPSASIADNPASATGASPVFSLSFSFVRSTIRLPPLHISQSISALISSAEHHWPPPSPSFPLYPHLSHHDCHHPYFPSSFPWFRRHLSAPSTAGFSPSSPSSAVVAPCSLFTLPSLLPFSLSGLHLAPPSSPIFLSAMVIFFP